MKSKVEAQAETKMCSSKNTKLSHKGALHRSCDLLLNFGTPVISGKAKDTNLKFRTRLRVTDNKQ